MTDDRPELAPVRQGEELDWGRLADRLRTEVDGLVGDMQVLQFPNGAANLTYQVTFAAGTSDERRLVVRRPPFGRIAPGAHDMGREFKAITSLHPVYDRAPVGVLHCTDTDVIGAEFMVTEYRPGVVVWKKIPETMGDPVAAGRAIGFAVVDALADLHAVDVTTGPISTLGRPAGFLARQVAGWTKRWEAVTTPGENPRMDLLGRTLGDALPEELAPAVVHNDYKVDNCQFTPDDPTRVLSVFDWDMATLGDPLVDVGTLLNYWPSDDGQPSAMAVSGLEDLGLPQRDEVIARYAERSGRTVEHVAWYEAYGCWKTAVIMQQLYARYLRGETTDERMATRGPLIDKLAVRGLTLMGVDAPVG